MASAARPAARCHPRLSMWSRLPVASCRRALIACHQVCHIGLTEPPIESQQDHGPQWLSGGAEKVVDLVTGELLLAGGVPGPPNRLARGASEQRTEPHR